MTNAFYDKLAPFYHLLYEDWEASIATQADALGSLLERHGLREGRVLDAACGIGTQALGLASKGYDLHASDLSPLAIARLSTEAKSRGLLINAYVDDLRTLAGAQSQSMDAIVACDNSLPHLLGDEELLEAFRSALRVLKPRGVAVYSVRDYAAIKRVHPDVRPYGLRYDGADRYLATQVWEWDGPFYELRLYLTHETAAGDCNTEVMVTRYYAVTIDRLMELITHAGLVDVKRYDDVLFQPLVVGSKPG